MTKQEKIKEAYGNKFESLKHNIDSNGWIKEYDTYRSEFESLEFDYKTNSMRPLELKGIENNNGWIKIEKESDLPKGITDCWFKTNQGNIILGYFTTRGFFVNEGNDIELKFVTHYQTIQKPKPPIY